MIGAADLEILSLGVSRGGTFDEKDMASSQLSRHGVGRLLDFLASLTDRKLLEHNADGSFSVTDLARRILWDETVPENLRILRLLEIMPCSVEKMTGILGMKHDTVFHVVEELRKNRLVLMSPLRLDGKLVRTYEILPEGTAAIRQLDAGITTNVKRQSQAAAELLEDIIADIEDSPADPTILKKLRLLRDMLD